MKCVLTLLIIGLSACVTKGVHESNNVPQVFTRIQVGQMILVHGDSRIGTYISSPESFDTSSYWIEGPSGLIFIDTQFLVSAASESIEWAERMTGKKVVLAIVLHPNPDKFNGTAEFQRRGIPVITSQQVNEMIPSVHTDRLASFYDRYKPDYPLALPKPQSFGRVSQEMEAGGVKFKLHVLGAGCSASHVVVEFDKHLFVGDLVANLHHSWLEIGKIEEWLTRIAELKAIDPEFVHPGRGPAGGAELLTRQEEYLKTIIRFVKEEKPKGVLSEKKLEKLKAKIEMIYVGYGNDYFLDIGLPVEWERQVRISKKQPTK